MAELTAIGDGPPDAELMTDGDADGDAPETMAVESLPSPPPPSPPSPLPVFADNGQSGLPQV